jgi:hypothetical protein
MPIAVTAAAESRPALELGDRLFHQRQGQLNLACSQCHDDNWGKKLAGNVIPQAHPTGYPLYRLEWQAVGSLQRRLRTCMTGASSALPHAVAVCPASSIIASAARRRASARLNHPAPKIEKSDSDR